MFYKYSPEVGLAGSRVFLQNTLQEVSPDLRVSWAAEADPVTVGGGGVRGGGEAGEGWMRGRHTDKSQSSWYRDIGN